MGKKNLTKMLKKSLDKKSRVIFDLINQVEKTNEYISIDDLIDYDKLISIFKNNLNTLQKDLFLEIYSDTEYKVIKAEESMIYLASEKDFKNEFLTEEIKSEIYKELIKGSLAIDYVKVDDERKTIIAMQFNPENANESLSKNTNKKEIASNMIYIRDEKDMVVKTLYIHKIKSISQLPY